MRKIVTGSNYKEGYAVFQNKLHTDTLQRGDVQGGINSDFDYYFEKQILSVSISGVTGDTTLISGVAGRQIEVESYLVTCNNDTNISFRSNTSFLTGPMYTLSGNSLIGDDAKLRTNPGEALIINSDNANVNGSLSYKIL